MILAIIVTEFPEPSRARRAMGAYVFVSVAGGSLGLLAGGLLTQALSWNWVFFVNLPIGVVTFVLGRAIIRADQGLGLEHGVDWVGSLLVTASLDERHLRDRRGDHPRLGLGAGARMGALAAALMAAFVTLEARIENPIMPLRILRVPGLINASLVRGFLVTGMYSTFFLGTLYLEHVRDFSALRDGRGVPAVDAHRRRALAGITARLVERFGPLPVLTTGMAIAAAGLLLFATVGPETAYFPTIFFASFMIGLGHRQRVHATADAGHGRRPGRRRRARLGDHQRLPADQRRARARRAEHRRREPHAGTGLRRQRAHELTARRLPRRLLPGAVAIGAGIVLAMALPAAAHPQRPPLDRIPARLTMEEQAA